MTILMVNQPTRGGLGPAKSPFEVALEKQVDNSVRQQLGIFPDQAEEQALREQLRAQAGLSLPYWQRQLLWTYKALTFDWGQLTGVNAAQLDLSGRSTATARDIVLEYFPNTLVLMGSAYLLVFVAGMPLALYLARHYGSRLDRGLTALSPLSSIPSWVLAILLIAWFAVELRWLPMSGMFDSHRPEQPLRYITVLLRHMVLPVSAIAISLIFQLVYAWRTFFVIYAEEDYVELAKAKGLRSSVVERQYVLRPALPFVLTSFSLSLVSFWQMTMALEVVFQWKGIGWLYISRALPNFWGDSYYPGELVMVVGIVVIFAFLLGIVVILLDIIYVVVDPRIRLSSGDITFGAVASGKAKPGSRSPLPTKSGDLGASRSSSHPSVLLQNLVSNLADSYYALRNGVRPLWWNLRRDPGAMVGILLIGLLCAGSAYAVFALPYEKIGRVWDYEHLTGRAYVPRLAAPAWSDLFVGSRRLSTLVLDEDPLQTTVSASAIHQGWTEKTTIFTIDYDYSELPSEVHLYLDPTYTKLHPFITPAWIYPDGTRLELKGAAVDGEQPYDFESGISVLRMLASHPAWGSWYHNEPPGSMPATDLLFVGPQASRPEARKGVYRLEVKSLLFEAGSDVRSQLVLLGQVYGVAGTDFWRRDLAVPLLWGMPFALVFGLLGATTTTMLAMLVSATGVWLGGAVDGLIQRFTEANMVVPVLAIGVLANALLGVSLWVILAVIVLLNVFGVPARTFRSAFLLERDAPYIEAARCYGASNFRIISRYLMPRILPTLIPQLVMLVPSFVFLEATLGLFNIRSSYPTWGRIISEGLSKGALYGSRFWVLEPIALLLLTGLAFALLGSALERALNPRMMSQVLSMPGARNDLAAASAVQERKNFRLSPTILGASAFLAIVLIALVWMRNRPLQPARNSPPHPARVLATAATLSPTAAAATTQPLARSSPTPLVGATSGMDSITPVSPNQVAESTPMLTGTPVLATAAVVPAEAARVYVLQRGEFPYCIARRFNVDPVELLAWNGIQDRRIFFAGTVLQMPPSGRPFPGSRTLRPHPATHTVARANESIYTVACLFGDVEPLQIAQSNNIPIDSNLYIGQLLRVP